MATPGTFIKIMAIAYVWSLFKSHLHNKTSNWNLKKVVVNSGLTVFFIRFFYMFYNFFMFLLYLNNTKGITNLIVLSEQSETFAAPTSQVQPLQIGNLDQDGAKASDDSPVKVVT
jgi:hypothetical protein